ncbi:prenyltransferase/squalene oxidase repeat-containing protein [Verrucomicrobiota bacterium]
MTTRTDEFSEFPSPYDTAVLLRTWGFRQEVARVVRGLKQPRTSGEYKYAVFQIKRLWAPVAALVVPVLVLLLLCLTPRPRRPVEHLSTVTYVQSAPVQPLDDTPPPPPTAEPRILDVALPEIPPAPGPSMNQDPEVRSRSIAAALLPVTLGMVADSRSPFALGGFYGKRMGAAKMAALAKAGAVRGTETAVLRALRWLKQHQEHDGSWHLGSADGPESGAAPAMTGLALLAFLAHGETPDPRCEEFGPTVQRGLEWLLASQTENGRFAGQDSHEYGHPIATYALSEAFGMTRHPHIKTAAEAATGVIIRGQNATGGWDYNCRPSSRADTSYMGWCVQALKAAQIAGIEAPGLQAAMLRAVEGFKKNASVVQGGFGYTGPGRHALTCVGVLGMQLLGVGNAPEARRGGRSLREATCDWDRPWGTNPVYYWYYITQARFHAGGSAWSDWNRRFAPELMRRQIVVRGEDERSETGHWEPASAKEHSQSPVYTTVLCVLSLEVYYRVLPTYDPRKLEIHSPDQAEEVGEISVAVKP